MLADHTQFLIDILVGIGDDVGKGNLFARNELLNDSLLLAVETYNYFKDIEKDNL